MPSSSSSTLLLLCAVFSGSSLSTTLAQPNYIKDSYEPVKCQVGLPDPIQFRVASNIWSGKTSSEKAIGVTGGGWNNVHCEITSRSLQDGETFTVIGNKRQVGVGVCIESCELNESRCGIRFNHNCVGFYGDNSNYMFAADESRKEYKIPSDNNMSVVQGIKYNQEDHCVYHTASRGQTCTPLPDHFRNKPLRAIGQVWNSARATLPCVEIGGSDSSPVTLTPTTPPVQGQKDTTYTTAPFTTAEHQVKKMDIDSECTFPNGFGSAPTCNWTVTLNYCDLAGTSCASGTFKASGTGPDPYNIEEGSGTGSFTNISGKMDSVFDVGSSQLKQMQLQLCFY